AQLPVFYGEPTCRTSIAGKPHERAALQYAMPSPDGKTVFVEIGTLYGPPNVVAESRFVAIFDLSDPYKPVQLNSIPVGAGNDTRDHALTGDGKLLLVPNSLDNSVSVIDVALRQVVRTLPTVTKPSRVVTFSEGSGPSKPVGPATLGKKTKIQSRQGSFIHPNGMTEMSKQLSLKVALILLLSAGPSAACDPEEMINELRAQCRDAIPSAVALIEPIKPALTMPERNAVETKVKEATALCNTDKYSDG